MVVIFFGTPHFAVPSLSKLSDKHEIVMVVTQPERPKGRKLKRHPSPVKRWAVEKNIPVLEPVNVNDHETIETIRSFNPDVIVVAAYGQILSERLLKSPKQGCVNVHASLLPAYRGAAPIQRALMDGADSTGVTIMLMDTGMDTGDIFEQKEIRIDDEDDNTVLTGKLADLGADLIEKVLGDIEAGTARAKPQNDQYASYAPMINKTEYEIDWKKPADTLAHLVKSLRPAPGAFTYWHKKRLKVIRVKEYEAKGDKPGILTVENEKLIVATGRGSLELIEVQPEGKKPMAGAEFFRGYHPLTGDHLG
ncbi:MAG TPA: methionyl-tRNA formyltransferase [Actinobacteria bacterium]|nr:methionyl-tRNA formyltransferase [Actinomycetota bacterium]